MVQHGTAQDIPSLMKLQGVHYQENKIVHETICPCFRVYCLGVFKKLLIKDTIQAQIETQQKLLIKGII
jgi:hypothetical protein